MIINNKLKKKQKAITIIEVLIAIFITAVGLAGISKTYFMINSNVHFLNTELIASNIAEQKLEEFRNYSSIFGANDSYDSITTNSGSPEITIVNNITYSTTWTVIENVTPNFKEIAVTVSWNTKDNINQEIVLETVIAREAPENSGLLFQNLNSGLITRP